MVLKIAVDTANEPVSAMMTTARESSRCCRAMDAATTPERPPATGRVIWASVRRPANSANPDTRHANSAAPTHSINGARNVT